MAKKERKSSDGKGQAVNEPAVEGGGRRKEEGDRVMKVKREKAEEDKQGAREGKTKERRIEGESELRGAVGSRGKKADEKEEKEGKEGKEGKAKKEKKEKKEREKGKGKDKDKEEEDKVKEASSGSPKKRKQRPEKQGDEKGDDGDLGKKKVKIERKEGKVKTSTRDQGREATRKNYGYGHGDETEKGEEIMPPPTDRSKCKVQRIEMQLIEDETGKKTYKCDGCDRLLTTYNHFRKHKWKINSWRRKVGLPPLQGDDDEEGKGKGSSGGTRKLKKGVKRFKRDGKVQLKRRGVCRAWQKGECKYGVDKCRFRHEADSVSKSAGKRKKAASTSKGEKAQTEFRLEKEEPFLRQDSLKKGKTAKKVRLLKKSNKPKKLSKKTNTHEKS